MTDHLASSAHGFTEGSDEVGGIAEQRCVTCGARQSDPCPAEEPACRFDMRVTTIGDHPGKAALAAIMEAAERVANIHADYDEFDGDRRGIYAALIEAREKLVAMVVQKSIAADASAYVASLEAENARLRKALNTTLIGGNHLGLVIGADHPRFEATHEEALTLYGPGDKYEVWCAWKAIMYARAALGGDTR